MPRLIDADKLLEIYKRWIPQLSSKEDEGDRRGVETCISVLEAMQTVDAIPVVRCMECKFRSSWMMNRNLIYICPESGLFPNGENDFCSYGERKEAE